MKKQLEELTEIEREHIFMAKYLNLDSTVSPVALTKSGGTKKRRMKKKTMRRTRRLHHRRKSIYKKRSNK